MLMYDIYTTYMPIENLPTTGYDSDAEEAADEGKRGTGTGNANLPGSGGEIGGRSNGGVDDGSRTTRQVIITLSLLILKAVFENSF